MPLFILSEGGYEIFLPKDYTQIFRIFSYSRIPACVALVPLDTKDTRIQGQRTLFLFQGQGGERAGGSLKRSLLTFDACILRKWPKDSAHASEFTRAFWLATLAVILDLGFACHPLSDTKIVLLESPRTLVPALRVRACARSLARSLYG